MELNEAIKQNRELILKIKNKVDCEDGRKELAKEVGDAIIKEFEEIHKKSIREINKYITKEQGKKFDAFRLNQYGRDVETAIFFLLTLAAKSKADLDLLEIQEIPNRFDIIDL